MLSGVGERQRFVRDWFVAMRPIYTPLPSLWDNCKYDHRRLTLKLTKRSNGHEMNMRKTSWIFLISERCKRISKIQYQVSINSDKNNNLNNTFHKNQQIETKNVDENERDNCFSTIVVSYKIQLLWTNQWGRTKQIRYTVYIHIRGY